MITTAVPHTQVLSPPKPLTPVLIQLSPGAITRLMGMALCGLTFASLAGQLAIYIGGYTTFGGVIPLFDLDDEKNVPTWYSSTMLLLCAIVLGVIASARKQDGDGYVWHWRILAMIFLGLSLDETAGLHEMTMKPLRSMLGASGVLHYTWVVLGAAFFLIFVVAYLKFFMQLPHRTRYLIAAGGTLYVGGALGMELVGGYYVSLHGHRNLVFALLTTIEEIGEMAGVLIFMYALMSYISTSIQDLTIAVAGHEQHFPE